jgi:hypothetical protein
MSQSPAATVQAKRAAASRKRNAPQREAAKALDAALKAYFAARAEAKANGTPYPNIDQFTGGLSK